MAFSERHGKSYPKSPGWDSTPKGRASKSMLSYSLAPPHSQCHWPGVPRKGHWEGSEEQQLELWGEGRAGRIDSGLWACVCVCVHVYQNLCTHAHQHVTVGIYDYVSVCVCKCTHM